MCRSKISILQDSEFFMKDYYRGQQLRGDLGVLEQAKWIKTTTSHSSTAAKKHPEKTVTVTVQKVCVCVRPFFSYIYVRKCDLFYFQLSIFFLD